MISIFYTNIPNQLPVQLFDYWFAQLAPNMQHQISRYRFWHDAQRSLLGKALLIKGLKQLDSINVNLAAIQYTQHGKPYLPNSQWSFNISHSGNVIVCVLAKLMEVGIDVEEIKPIPLSDFTTLFNEAELAGIFADEANFVPFYTLWTQKEAFVKAIGQGLSLPLNEVNIVDDNIVYRNNRWHLAPINLHPGYICHLACNKPLGKVNVYNISFFSNP